MKKIKLAIINDIPMVLEYIQHLLNNQPDMVVKISARDVDEFIGKSKKLKGIDIVISNIKISSESGSDLYTYLRTNFPLTKVIILSPEKNRYTIMRMLECGANAYITHDDSTDLLIEAIRKVYSYGRYTIEDYVGFMAEHLAIRQNKKEIRNTGIKLTNNEMAVLSLISEEFSTKEIAMLLNYTTVQITGFKTSLYRKTKTNNSIGLFKFALKNGLCTVNAEKFKIPLGIGYQES